MAVDRPPFVPVAATNNTGNARTGKSYVVSAAKGGNWHTYDNGKRVFVPSDKKKKKATPVGPGTKFPNAQVNTTRNARSGQSFFSSQAKGGNFHSYGNGKQIFVKKKTP